MQLDVHVGYRARLGGQRTLDVFGEVFNVHGIPRQLQIGVRLGF